MPKDEGSKKGSLAMYIIIVGCGRSGSRLANQLSEEGHDIVVIDKDKQAFQRLGSLFNGLTYQGNGTDRNLLEEAGIQKAHGIALMTNSDTSNAMMAQIAKKIYQVKRVIAKIYDPELADTLRDFGFDIISTTVLISQLVRDRFIEDSLRVCYRGYEGRLELVEVPSHEKIIGKKYGNLNVPGVFTIITCKNGSNLLMPTPDMVVRKEDTLLCLLNQAKRNEVLDLLGPAFNQPKL
ncbi:MAG: TrkA family potassium uptake protein [bacterium]|nr:TrkA family potassium uptake protein [bacterium]